jgi:ADP-ribosylglycohydrolase
VHDVLDPKDLLADELAQRRESGHDVAALEAPVSDALETAAPDELERLLVEVESAPLRADWNYEEPSDLEEILAVRPAATPPPALELDEAELLDRIHAAWLGRCAGCNLGKPVEGVVWEDMVRYLRAVDAYPLEDYIPAAAQGDGNLRMHPSWPDSTRGNIRFMARDDDMDYTILALHVLETDGFDFTAADVGRHWLERFPFLQIYTAERAAYRNLILGLAPPETASHRNPHREWIGAQIRADMFGYVSPGDPAQAAALGHADAALSHTANGIYGEMWAAGLIAACFTAPDMRTALDAAAAVIPPRSRLMEALRHLDELHGRGLDWETACVRLRQRYGHYSFVHTINNAAVVAAALLWGEGDFTRTIGLAVQGGWDTDCNGATAGSAFGAMHGRAALPARWVDPLSDRIRSALFGYDNTRISDLAVRTVRLAVAHTVALTSGA